MKYIKDGKSYIVRIDRGEEVLDKLNEFIKETDIKAASITGIGASSEVELGVYSVKKREYIKNKYEGEFEILSLIGNITQDAGEPYIHLHIMISDGMVLAGGLTCGMGITVGGHLNKCIISGTCELRIDECENAYQRRVDDETGIKIIDI
ncbi:PPC domain-containing DNA-binding protein [uncultured Fenollaria sp.]|uniref:PPC domain-containing DNA-binding protein n=1 Tax=uncultured Fenollaria sp. TaxID=1686315 RepID=UPI0025FCB75D|nr:PPC domain-containing DNA-binding protein [uncultured Fenollaria sp.]